MATARKERACFVAEFLDAQAGPGGRRLYSQVASKTTEAKTAEAHMKSMETAICDVRRLLQNLTEPRAAVMVSGVVGNGRCNI